MKLLIIFLSITTVFFGCKAFKYYLTATVFSAWTVEKKYTPPTDDEIKRLTEWTVRQLLKKH